jgi:hypothetical protein
MLESPPTDGTRLVAPAPPGESRSADRETLAPGAGQTVADEQAQEDRRPRKALETGVLLNAQLVPQGPVSTLGSYHRQVPIDAMTRMNRSRTSLRRLEAGTIRILSFPSGPVTVKYAELTVSSRFPPPLGPGDASQSS